MLWLQSEHQSRHDLCDGKQLCIIGGLGSGSGEVTDVECVSAESSSSSQAGGFSGHRKPDLLIKSNPEPLHQCDVIACGEVSNADELLHILLKVSSAMKNKNDSSIGLVNAPQWSCHFYFLCTI